MIIDFHTHTFPDRIAETAVLSLEKSGNIKRAIDGKLSDLLESMEKCGIDKSVSCPVATKEKQVESINDSAIAIISSEKIIPFGCMHPLYEKPYEELRRIKEAGIKGIKLHPEYQRMSIDAPQNINILNICRELDLICLIHAGKDIAFPDSLMCPPKAVKKIVGELKGIKLVLAHMGGWNLWNEVRKTFDGDEVYIDTSFSFGFMTPQYMKDMLEGWDNDKVLFGTDSPWRNQKESVEEIVSLGLNEEYLQKILYKNAEKLLEKT